MYSAGSSRTPILIAVLILSASVFTSTLLHASSNSQTNLETGSWALHLDNDLLASSDRDQDYTGGFSIALPITERTRFKPGFGIESLHNKLNDVSGIGTFNRINASRSFRSIDVGVALFTPVDISSSESLQDQHPYASLFFINNTQQSLIPTRRLSVTSTFSIGVLGLSLGGDLQRELHRSIGSTSPQGWDHQISAGGELTARYALGGQKNLLAMRSIMGTGMRTAMDVNLIGQLSVGYTTEATAGINARVGLTSSPWWTFNPHQSAYTKLSTPAALSNINTHPDLFFYVGAQARYRAYSALLQGQFRHSNVVFESSELEKLLYETWAGVSLQLNKAVSTDLFIRSRSASIKDDASSEMVWGGLAFKFNT